MHRGAPRGAGRSSWGGALAGAFLASRHNKLPQPPHVCTQQRGSLGTVARCESRCLHRGIAERGAETPTLTTSTTLSPCRRCFHQTAAAQGAHHGTAEHQRRARCHSDEKGPVPVLGPAYFSAPLHANRSPLLSFQAIVDTALESSVSALSNRSFQCRVNEHLGATQWRVGGACTSELHSAGLSAGCLTMASPAAHRWLCR